jgi:hypothetical protein
MKRLIARPRSLLLAVALTVVAALFAVSTANAASAASDSVVPLAPSNLAAKAVGTTSVELTWKNNAANQSGVVLSLNGVKSVDVQGATVSSYIWSGLSSGTQYWFYIASKIYGTPGDPTGSGNTQSAWVGPVYATTPTTSPSHRTSPNSNWAGWGTTVKRDYSGITGDFQVPNLTGKNGWVAIWDGLGGTTCNEGLEQTGISAKIVKGKPVYQAWWEVLYFNPIKHRGGGCWNKDQAANNPHFFKQSIKPGDWIQVSVTYSSSPAATDGTYWLFLKDVTRRWSENVPVTAKGLTGTTSRDSAESIVEDVNAGPLPDFKTAYPGNVRVYPSPNQDYGWTQQNPTEYTLNGGKVNVALISPVGDFTVTWNHS